MSKFLGFLLIQLILLKEIKQSLTSTSNNVILELKSSPETLGQTSNEVVLNNPVSSQARQMNQIIRQKQIISNQIGTGLQTSSSDNNSFQQFIRSFGKRYFNENTLGDINQRRRGFITRARTVESPALSVDSGGHSSSSIAGEIAKILDIKQGHYADIYDKIDKPGGTTKKPADAIEETIRNAVQRFMAKRFHYHNSKRNKSNNNNNNIQ